MTLGQRFNCLLRVEQGCACSAFVELDSLDLLALAQQSQHLCLQIGIGLRRARQAGTTLQRFDGILGVLQTTTGVVRVNLDYFELLSLIQQRPKFLFEIGSERLSFGHHRTARSADCRTERIRGFTGRANRHGRILSVGISSDQGSVSSNNHSLARSTNNKSRVHWRMSSLRISSISSASNSISSLPRIG